MVRGHDERPVHRIARRPGRGRLHDRQYRHVRPLLECDLPRFRSSKLRREKHQDQPAAYRPARSPQAGEMNAIGFASTKVEYTLRHARCMAGSSSRSEEHPMNPVTNANLVSRLMLEKKTKLTKKK